VAFFNGLFNFLLILSSLFLICLVLIQRGKGGGLAGAFGGVGGSSAFGTKAGDVFTRITIVTASIWILLAMLLVILNNRPRASAFQSSFSSPNEVPVRGGAAPKSGTGTGTGTGTTPSVPPPITAPPTGKGAATTPETPRPPAGGKSSSALPDVFPESTTPAKPSGSAPAKRP
jgi:preprotein translocase subunit SecG